MNNKNPVGKTVAGLVRQPLLRRILISPAVLLLLFGLVGYFVLPGVVKSLAETRLSEILKRKVTIEAVEISPYALQATIRGVRMLEPDGAATFASFDELFVDVQAESIFRLAPVLGELRLAKPYLHLVRLDGRRYNFSDLIALIDSQPPAKEPAKFSINNIQISDGKIDFDDRPEKTLHTVADLKLGVPFVSNLPSQVEIFIEPVFAAKVDDAPLAIKAKARPFAAAHEASVDVDLDAIDLTRLINYLPFEPRFKMPSARLDLHLNASFQQAKDQAPALVVKGKTALSALELTEVDGRPLLKLPRLDLVLAEAQVFAKRVNIASVAVQAPEIDVVRGKRGELNLLKLAPRNQAASKTNAAATPEASGLDLTIAEFAVNAARVRVTDAVPETPFKTVIDKLDVVVRKFSLAGRVPAQLKLSAHTDADETLKHQGEFTLQPLAVKGDAELTGLAIARYAPPYLPTAAIDKGRLAATAKYAFSIDGDGQPQLVVSDAAATLADLALRLPGEKQPAITVERLGVAQTAFDLKKREVVIGEVSSKHAKFIVVRDPDGRINLQRLGKPPAKVAAPVAIAPTASASKTTGFKVAVKRIAIDDWSARIEDRSMAPAVVTTLGPLTLSAQDLSNLPGGRGRIAVKARVNQNGQLSAVGTAGLAPLHAKLALDLKRVDLLPLQPYFSAQLNVLVTRAALSARGTLALDQAKDGAFAGGFSGNFTVGEFASVDKANSADFLSWKSLAFGGVDAKISPFALSIDDIVLADFYARVIVNQDGRLNLQDVTRGKDEGAKSVTEATPAAARKPDAPPVPEQPAAPVKIRKITLQGGQVNFTDHFIRPNYTANLMELGGSVAGLSSEASTNADVDLRGQVNNAPLAIVGKINPLKGDLALDLKANVKGMELAPLTPYSGKYVGYGIEKGKLSFDVNYKIENRVLSADNRLVLDQLTFGDRIESPSATKLPVQLAVALLRDRHGVIDINLPIGGSLDDPQFSVGGIIVKVIVNVITKAVTAPFALLGSLFGGGAELSYLDFDAGRSAIPPAGEAKLKSLAKALAERPALKLEITGRTDPASDREGLRRASVERKLKALKLNTAVSKAESVDPDAIVLTADEYPVLLKRVYKDEKFPKPRNLVGLAKDLPVDEMEKLLITNAEVGDDDVTALGNQRAQAVKDWLVRNGQVAAERIFLLAAKSADGKAGGAAKEAGETPVSAAKPSRADFSLK